MGPVAYFSLCLLGCLIFNPSLAGTHAVSCPEGWLSFNHNCYGYFSQQTNWMEAEIECQHHWHGAHLASIHSDEENKKLAHYIKEKHKRNSAVWIGLSDPDHDLSWKWTDHSLYNYKAWDKGQPNNVKENEHCVGSHLGKGFQKWHDYHCKDKHSFVCKRKF